MGVHDRLTLEVLELPGARRPVFAADDREWSQHLLDRLGQLNLVELAVQRHLGALVGVPQVRATARDVPAHGEQTVALRQQAIDLAANPGVGHCRALTRPVDQAFAVPSRGPRVVEQHVQHVEGALTGARQPDRPEFRDAHAEATPAVPLVADPVLGGNDDVVHRDHVLLVAGHHLHRHDRQARQLRGRHEGAQVPVTVPLRIRHREHEVLVATEVAANEDLRPVDDVLVALPDGPCLHAGQVGSGVGLGEELPGDRLRLQDRRQEAALLLVGAEAPDGPGEAAPDVTRQAHVVEGGDAVVEFLVDDLDLLPGETAAAELGWPSGSVPALFRELAQELVIALEFLLGGVVAVRRRSHAFQVVLQPVDNLLAEVLQLVTVR